MDLTISDGTGGSNKAKVDSEHRLHVLAVARGELGNQSVLGSVYQWQTPIVTVASGAECSIFWFMHTDAARKFNLKRLAVSYNGGDTNHDRCLVGSMYAGAVAPTANATAVDGANLNLGLAGTASSSSAYKWDGVGSGMTHATLGSLAAQSVFQKGVTIIDYDGALIVPANLPLAFTSSVEETGKAGVMLIGWFE